MNKKNLKSFTMAEILLSLTIIGVVAAITLPSLTGNINERTWNTQRKALYARMSQAIALMGSLNGYGVGATEEQTASNATKAFVTDGLAKVLKINNICDAEHLADCGIPSKIVTSSATSKIDTPNNLVALNIKFNQSIAYATCPFAYSQMNTYAAAFETQNGESIITFYNPFCTDRLASPVDSDYQNLLQPTMCVNFVYDMNGKKGPNTIGKDIGFMTVFYPTDSQVVSPNPIRIETARTNEEVLASEKFCKSKYGEYARAANIEELKSLFVNLYLVHANGFSDTIASKTNIGNNIFKQIYFHTGTIRKRSLEDFDTRRFYCIK